MHFDRGVHKSQILMQQIMAGWDSISALSAQTDYFGSEKFQLT